jgi:GT2 family glycosyltransferase
MAKARSATDAAGPLARLDAWLRALNRRRLLRRRQAKHRAAERTWVAADDPSHPDAARALLARFAGLRQPAVLGIVMRPSGREPMPGWPWHRRSALTANWQLVAADPSAMAQLPGLLQSAATDVIALLPADCCLAPHAPALIAEAIARFPNFVLLYGDEDCVDSNGRRHSALLHGSWNPELLRSTPYLSGLIVVRRAALSALLSEGAQLQPAGWWDLLLRLTERAADSGIVHIPHVLSHRLADQRVSRHVSTPAAQPADVAAVQRHLERSGLDARAQASPHGGVHVRYAVPAPAPLVSLIIPTRNGLHLLRQCVQSILERTTYTPYELVIVDNGSDDPETLHYLRALQADPRIRVQRDDRPFNFAALNNAAVPLCRGRVLGFVNNDVEVISLGWLEEMVGLAMRADVGAVGARLWFSNATLQHAGVILGIGGVAAHIHQRLSREQPGYLGRAHVTQEFSAVTAACVLMRRDVFEQINGFDEVAFAVDFNDIDLCLRVRRAAYRVIWTPHAELFHHESATRGANWSDEQKARHAREFQRMRERWARWLDNDPAYNPNASLKNLDFAFSIATEPRASLSKPWFDQLP